MRVHTEPTGPHGQRLNLLSATKDDNGLYRCLLAQTGDKSAKQTAEFSLNVYKSTSFANTANHVKLSVGYSGQLKCLIETDNAATAVSVSWLRDGKPIESLQDSNTYKQSSFDSQAAISEGSSQSILEISPLLRTHDGNYTCRVTTDTQQMTKISDFTTQLETQYAPVFDSATQTVWIEKHLPSSSDLGNNRHNSYGKNGNDQSNAAESELARQQRQRFRNHQSQQVANNSELANNNSSIRVELRCTCQANPRASIVWTSSSSNIIFEPGKPRHIIDETQHVSGNNLTSILTINYSLNPQWEYKVDHYHCLARNELGSQTKKFIIEQGDLPPAFSVGSASVRQSPTSTRLDITILGPLFDGKQQQLQQPDSFLRLKPRIDWFRIRTEQQLADSRSTLSTNSNSNNNNNKYKYSSPSSSSLKQSGSHEIYIDTLNNNQNSISASNSGDQQYDRWQLSGESSAKFPQNFSIELTKLAAGSEQKLYLEAHNAVGWSPNSTYLGTFDIVRSNAIARYYSVCHIVAMLATICHFIVFLSQVQDM